MKRIVAISKPLALDTAKERLAAIGTEDLPLTGVNGVGRRETDTRPNRGLRDVAEPLPSGIAPASLYDLKVRLSKRRLRRLVLKALALTPRGFIPRDVLILTKLSGQLQVDWHARNIHPWNRTQPLHRQAELFRDLALNDTDTAVVRIFQTLPEINGLDVRVFAPQATNRLLLAGTVRRRDAIAARSHSSPGMRLKAMGVQYQIKNGHLAPLD